MVTLCLYYSPQIWKNDREQVDDYDLMWRNKAKWYTRLYELSHCPCVPRSLIKCRVKSHIMKHPVYVKNDTSIFSFYFIARVFFSSSIWNVTCLFAY